ncbi:hypothetical protein SAMN04488124_2823 [Halogeometricum limi]|uniref:Uncharacterized protein n=1 Tax=Halogeometricum limi TaxID=555875 RepID=A0A1I6I5R8_9EURY|nr:hypothetical protein SAMN04488124_2823 [Halogeometricum limi]
MRLDSSEFDTTATALTPLPWYEPEKDSSSPSGIYIRHEDATYAVYLQPYCADSIFVNAESERDVYGRGGCVPPEVRPENS